MNTPIIKISTVISNVCKKLNIDYISKYTNIIEQYQKDADQLADLYVHLKEVLGDIEDIASRYKMDIELKKMFKNTLETLDKIDHDLIYEARKIISRKQNNKGN